LYLRCASLPWRGDTIPSSKLAMALGDHGPKTTEEVSMATYRLYSGSDGKSHIDPIDLSTTPDWTKGLNATQISFREAPVGRSSDWHVAPRRQFVIVLEGELEIGLGDGSKHIFGPGDARLVEDTTGQGHTTAVHGDKPCLTATVPLA